MDERVGTENQTSKTVLNKDWIQPTDLNFQYVIGCDPYKVEEPLNFWHEIKAKMGLQYRTKDAGRSYTVCKLSKIEGKLVAEFKGREL